MSLFPNSNGEWAATTSTQNLVDDYELTNGLLPSESGSGYDDQNPYVNRDSRFYETIYYITELRSKVVYIVRIAIRLTLTLLCWQVKIRTLQYLPTHTQCFEDRI